MALPREASVTEGSTLVRIIRCRGGYIGRPREDTALMGAGDNEISTRQNRQFSVLYEGDISH